MSQIGEKFIWINEWNLTANAHLFDFNEDLLLWFHRNSTKCVCESVWKMHKTPLCIWNKDYACICIKPHVWQKLSNWVTVYQTRKHIILWAIIHGLLIDPKERQMRKKNSQSVRSHTHRIKTEKKISTLKRKKKHTTNKC